MWATVAVLGLFSRHVELIQLSCQLFAASALTLFICQEK